MSTTMDFEEELEVFRTEEEVAQQYFFAYLSVRSLAASSKDVLANMNTTALFWRTTHHAMLVAAFLALGRIFDQDPKSDHNIDKLMRAASAAQAQGLFSKAALAQRKTGISSQRRRRNRLVAISAHIAGFRIHKARRQAQRAEARS